MRDPRSSPRRLSVYSRVFAALPKAWSDEEKRLGARSPVSAGVVTVFASTCDNVVTPSDCAVMREGPSITSARLCDISGPLPPLGRQACRLPPCAGRSATNTGHPAGKVPRACRGPNLSDMSATFET
jgi:hypothetical protein